MFKTESRPVPLPGQGSEPNMARPRKVRYPSRDEHGELVAPPKPAEMLAWIYCGPDGKTVKSKFPVPVDETGKITHREFECPECDGSAEWVSAKARITPICPVHKRNLRQVTSLHRRPAVGPPWAKVWRSQRERVYVAAGCAAVGAAGAAVEYASMPWWGHATQLAAIPAVVASSWWLCRWVLTRRAVKAGKLHAADEVGGQRERRKIARRARAAGYAATAAALWVEAADLAGLQHGRPEANGTVAAVLLLSLAALGAVASRPYLRWVDARRPTRPTAPAAEGTPDEAALRDAADWEATVARDGGLPGTFVDVTTWKADAAGRTMVIRNKQRRGALTDERMRMALPLIAGAFDVPRSVIGWVEEYGGSPNAARLLVQPNSPLYERVDWKGVDVLDVADAFAHMGLRLDGTDLRTRLWTSGWGAPSRLFLGTKGSGKTAALRLLLAALLKARIMRPNGTPTRLVAPFLHDPKRGADYGAFRRQVCGFSIDRDALHMIVDAVIREMDRRYDALANTTWRDGKGRQREGERPFDPAVDGPIISLVIDEFHEPAKDTALMAKFEPMSRKMRAAGIEINAATHLATIGDTGSQGFRDMVAGGEAWLLRTTMALNAALATGGTLAGDPRALPRIPGMLLHASGDDVTMQARTAYVEEMYDLLYDDGNESLIQPVDWPQETLEAFGPDFVQWMAESQRRPVGGAYVGAPASFRASGPQVQGEDRRALDVLLDVLASAGKPLRRADIMEAPAWTYSLKTLSNCLRAGQDAEPALVRKAPGSSGAYELTGDGVAFADVERGRRESSAAEAATEAAGMSAAGMAR